MGVPAGEGVELPDHIFCEHRGEEAFGGRGGEVGKDLGGEGFHPVLEAVAGVSESAILAGGREEVSNYS